MAQRVKLHEVEKLVDYNDKIEMQPFIDIATAITDKVSSNDSLSLLNSALLKEIEKNLAAHYYSLRDPAYLQKKTGDASATFYGETGKGLDFTPYGQTAKDLDLTGFLNSLGKSQPSIGWLGKTESEARTYEERNGV